MVREPGDDLRKYRPLAFWAWNGTLEEKRLKVQINEMQDSAAGGFFMHARAGLKTEYMSEKWMHYVKTCALYAKQKKMDAWLYDEHGWPSGFAGGLLLEREEFHDKYLLYTSGEWNANADYCYQIREGRLVRVAEEEKGREESEEEYLNLYVKTAVSTVDILNPKVTEAFIENTYEKYNVYFGGKLSSYIRGFFTDEPQYQRCHTAYSDMLPGYFQRNYGMDIFDFLGLLFVKAEGYRRFRHAYWKAMQQLMLQNYAKKIYNWCREHGVEFTGHYIEENSLFGQMMCCGGVMPFYEYEHIPGIDWIISRCEYELAPRQAGSVAAQLGKKQVLTESYAGFGWEISPRELKRITEFQFVNGANLLCEHLFPYSEAGQAKYDFPAHYSYVNPWVKECGDAYHTYMARLSRILAESREIVNVAVLHPIRSAYLVFQREEPDGGRELAELDKKLREDIKSLSCRGINYHFIDETILARHGFTDGARIGCGRCAYDYLVLPHVTNMDRTTEDLIRNYVEAGGKVLILGEAPRYLEGEEYSYSYLESNCSLEEIAAAQPCRAAKANDMVYSSLRESDSGRFLFVMNMSTQKGYDHTFLCRDAQSFVRFDLETGETMAEGLKIRLEPGESKILFLRHEKMNKKAAEEENQRKNKPVTVFELNRAEVSFDRNYLTVDRVQYSLDGEEFSSFYDCIELFRKLLCDRFRGTIYFRYTFEIRNMPDQITILAECGNAKCCWLNGHKIRTWERTEAEPDLLSSPITFYVCQGRNTFTFETDWYEREDVYYALLGENATESLKNKVVFDRELGAVYLCGNFGVYTDGAFEADTKNTVKAGDFYIGQCPCMVTEPVKEGLPFFRGNMTVRQNIHLLSGKTYLKIPGTWSRADVRINGRAAGRLILTDRLDISKYAVSGDNEVEIMFTVSNRNLMGPHHNSGKEVIVSPESYGMGGFGENEKKTIFAEKYRLLLLGVKNSEERSS